MNRDSVDPMKVVKLVRKYYREDDNDGSALLDELLEQGMLNPAERKLATVQRFSNKRVLVKWGHPTEQFVFKVS